MKTLQSKQDQWQT